MRGGRLYLIAAACLVPASWFVAIPARGQDWEIIEAPLVMPVASAGEKDRSNDKDKRYRINLTEHGEILYKGKQYSLAELAKLLNGLKKRYGKFKDFGKRPYQVKTSELFLLFRVDRDAPWGHVQWLRKTATEAQFYKFQYGVKLHADRTYTKEEVERLGAAWEDRPAPKAGRLEGKLVCFEPIERLPGGDGLRVLHEFATTSRVHVEVVATKMGQRGWPDSKLRFRVPLEIKYRLEERETSDVRELGRWLKEVSKGKDEEKTEYILAAGSQTPFKFVMAALNQFHVARTERVRLNEAAPHEVERKAQRLPYPLHNKLPPRKTDEETDR